MLNVAQLNIISKTCQNNLKWVLTRFFFIFLLTIALHTAQQANYRSNQPFQKE